MRTHTRIALVFTLAAAGVLAAPGGSLAAEKPGTTCGTRDTVRSPHLRILFIGNSYTYVNNLPRLFEAIAEACEPGTAVEVEAVVRGSATLRDLWGAGEAPQRIRSAKWDYVVLQEQSTLGPIEDGQHEPGSVINDSRQFHDSARQFDELIRKAGARTVFMMTWSRRHHPELQETIARAYESIAAERGAILVPAGRAWRATMTEAPQSELYMSDRSHPAPQGSYLAAATLYATLFCRSPEGAPRRVVGEDIDPDARDSSAAHKTSVLVDLSPQQAKLLQQAAARARGKCPRD